MFNKTMYVGRLCLKLDGSMLNCLSLILNFRADCSLEYLGEKKIKI